MASTKRIVAVIAGGRSGKTSLAPAWLHREMGRKGPGDYLVAAPNYPLIDKAAGPEIEHYFGRLLRAGKMKRSAPQQFCFSPDGCLRIWGRVPERQPRILFGHADEPESLEAMSAKAAWLDEAGQERFKLGSWEAVQQRLSIDSGRVLITTKPYNLGWLKQLVYDPWEAAGRRHAEIDVFQFDSTMNPAFPREEWERARAVLPRWKFDMQYRGVFTRPAGLIYDSFDPQRHKAPRFRLPDSWQRYLGLDFGGANTAGLFYAEEPGTKKLYLYREYKAGNLTAAGHVKALLAGEPMTPVCVGGSHSEGQWRAEFRAAGLPVQEPAVKEVEVGIDRVYGAHQRGEIVVFADLAGYLAEKAAYSRVLDSRGEPTEAIDDKHSFHFMDAERYVIGWVRRATATGPVGTAQGDARSSFARAPKGVF